MSDTEKIMQGIDDVDARAFVSKLMCGIMRIGRGAPSFDDVTMEDIENEDFYRREPKITRKEMLSDVYKMDYEKRGKAIVINNKNFTPDMVRRGYGVRTGTDIDCTRICKRLEILGFDVDRRHDATCFEIKEAFALAAQEDHSDEDCFVGVLLSHGEEDKICGTDGTVELQDIFTYFKGNNCNTLAGKPKLFFIQACRGHKFDSGQNLNTIDAKRGYDDAFEKAEDIRIPNEADFLLSYSTVPGFYSWRNSTNGSWYIQGLVHVLDQYGTTLEVQKLLTKLNKIVAYQDKFMSNTNDPSMHGKKQIPSFTSMLTKDLYFLPKQQ
ncbi:caspase-3-like isoform X2 [Mya arenaria]|uniref:caspase-3-like isoform X2 n=1 Tax=Mya arenaria TaxID=6604 RepID=UPI0022E10EE2|nr:caspase-3-like isoform X2 [Mya arenaria]